MRLDVQLFGDRALIECVPSIVERILFGRATVDRYAVLRGGNWCDCQTGRLVDAAFDTALRQARTAD